MGLFGTMYLKWNSVLDEDQTLQHTIHSAQ